MHLRIFIRIHKDHERLNAVDLLVAYAEVEFHLLGAFGIWNFVIFRFHNKNEACLLCK